MASESVFLSALQPNSSVTTFGLPSEIGNGNTVSDEASKARRVQQQVQMRMSIKSTLPRQNGSASHYAMSDYGGSSTAKYQTFNPSFSSKSSYMYSGSKTMPSHASQRSGFTCQSAGPDMAQFHKISVGGGGVGGVGGVGGMGGGGGGGYYREDLRMGGYQRSMRQQNQMDQEPMYMSAMGQQAAQLHPWMVDGSDVGSLISDRDATFSRQYTQSAGNFYTSQVGQGGGTIMRRAQSGTLSRGGEMTGGDVMIGQQQSFKGPAHRTINRITNRNRMSMGSVSGTMQRQMSNGSCYVGSGGLDRVDRGFISAGVSSGSQGNLAMQRQGTLSRAMSIKSMQSVGRGMDIYGGQMEMGASMGNLSGIATLDMATAVQNLREPDPELQVLGAAYIQHECYNDSDAKVEVRRLKGIGELVKLFNNENQEVQRFATGATRNLIFENMDNKVALIEEGGIPQLVEALKEPDDELRKNITGILWNLSSKDNLKEKLAKETLLDLTERILIPLSNKGDTEGTELTASESEIFYNTTGCIRNLSSVSEKTRQKMRETPGLVDSLVRYIKGSLEVNKTEDKGVENSACILRNLSYQLYGELSPSVLARLEGPSRDQDQRKGEAIGCFTPQSRKAENSKRDLAMFTEVAREPRGMEWLWHPQILHVYNLLMKNCQINSTTREAAAGAVQNITAGDKRWASVLSQVAVEQQFIHHSLMDNLEHTNNDLEKRSITGSLRNLSRHARDKNKLASVLVKNLVNKLPADGYQKNPSSEVVVNICGILNNLVTTSQIAASEIAFDDGLNKLMSIKTSHDNSSGKLKAARAAATVLSNMFQYKKLHKEYKKKGFMKRDFEDVPF